MTEKVSVGSSLEIGVELQLCERGVDDGSDHRPMVKKGPVVQVHGTRTPGIEVRNGQAITHGVDPEFFSKWIEQNPSLAGRLTIITPLP